MRYYSTRSRGTHTTLREAVLSGLAPDGGLYMPESIPELAPQSFTGLSLHEIACIAGLPFVESEVSASDYQDMVSRAFPFDAPLVMLNDSLGVLELFHGPTLAFKDFGARFMAELMSYLIRGDSSPLTILVATSGDTGSAVAHGFLGVPGIHVVLLYPSDKVSAIQEKQLTTCGGNITALKVNGTFDDCQLLVKEAFSNKELRKRKRLTSANSINIARLIPQSFYYFRGISQLPSHVPPTHVAVPSGNFGNLTAGLLAQKMGAPIAHFLAATNANDIVPEFLKTDVFRPRPSQQTLSNAMDVGNPSNFERMKELLGNSASEFKTHLTGYSYTDEETVAGISSLKEKTGYFMCPHTALGALALTESGKSGFTLATAHPVKFQEELHRAGLDTSELIVPERLKDIIEGKSQSIPMRPNTADFFELLGEI